MINHKCQTFHLSGWPSWCGRRQKLCSSDPISKDMQKQEILNPIRESLSAPGGMRSEKGCPPLTLTTHRLLLMVKLHCRCQPKKDHRL